MISNNLKVKLCFPIVLTIIQFVLPLSATTQKSWLSFSPKTTKGVGIQKEAINEKKPRMKFVERGRKGYIIDYEFPGARLSSIEAEGSRYHLISVDKFGKLRHPGRPLLPARQFTFAIPLGHRAEVHLIYAHKTSHANYMVLPAKKPQADNRNVKDSEFEIDSSFYESDQIFPSTPVSIIDERIYRGNKMMSVQVCPVQFIPARKRLITYYKMRFEIRYIPEDTKAPLQIRSTRISKKILRNIADDGSTYSYKGDKIKTATSLNLAQGDASVNPGIGMVIVTVDDFLSASEEIAKWKRKMGYTVEIISQPAWANSNAVKSVIHDRYRTMSSGLDFALILGDHEFVPSEWSTHGPHDHVTDLYYACMDGEGDFTPDIAIGRIPAESSTDAITMVTKIINYERNPVNNDNFYRHGLCATYFQQSALGYAARRFAQGAWAMRQYLINNYNYIIDRQFYTESNVYPLYWNNGDFSNGEPIPDYLRKPNYMWDGNATDISAGINNGRFFVFHRDHGSITSWKHPLYTVNDINALNNGDQLPVVFSINCKTGMFAETNSCFSEVFLRHTSGAVGVISASQTSYSGPNDALSDGLVDAIWPTPGLALSFPHNPEPDITPHEPIYHMGLVLSQGKMRMSETWNSGTPPSDFEQYTYELFHYFGDPSMRIWTDIPQDITAFYSSTISTGDNTFTITEANCNEGIATLYFDGKIIGSCQLNGGSGQITLDPMPTSLNTAELTITAHNFRPLEANISIIPGDDVIYIYSPAAGTQFDHGDVTVITWQTFGAISDVTIFFSSDAGATYTTIEPSTANDGSYTWIVPSDVNSDQCIIKIEEIDGYPVDESDLFSIQDLSRISGTVTGRSPSKVDYNGPQSGSIFTGENGSFSINRLRPGNYELIAHDDQYSSDAITINLPPDHTNVSISIRYPEISYTPDSFTETLDPGQTTEQTLIISNLGDADLNYNNLLVELPSDEGIDGKGGPDGYKYRWIDSDDPNGPEYSWTSISSTGEILWEVSDCDDCRELVPLSFQFEYYGELYTAVNVSTNGFITFGSIDKMSTNYRLPNPDAPAGIIAPFHDDLSFESFGASRTIYFQSFKTHAVIQYDNASIAEGSGSFTFQVHLLANNKIRFYYNNMDGILTNATVGWQNITKDDGHTIAYNEAYIHNNLAVEISRTPDWLSVSLESGTISPGGSEELTVTFDATDLIPGIYHGQIKLGHNDLDADNPIKIPCNLTVVDQSISIEAEDQTTCSWISGTSIDDDHNGFTGTGYVNTPNEPGTWTECQVTVPGTRVYRINVRYANGKSDREAQLIINGSAVATGEYVNTGVWSIWDDEIFTNISLNAGTNTVRLTATTSGGLANIDHFEFIPAEMEYYNLILRAEGNGSIVSSPSGTSFPQYTEIELKAQPDPGYKFVEWGGDLLGSKNPDTIVLDCGQYIIAIFEPEPTSSSIEAGDPASCSWISGTSVDNEHPGFTGSGYVNTPNESGAWTECQVDVFAAGVYQINIRYANGSSDRAAQLIVNGSTVGNGSFESTENWTTWDNETYANVTLNTGVNTIRLLASTSGGLANIDRFDISQ